MRQRIIAGALGLACLCTSSAWARTACADADEASLHAHVSFGSITTSDHHAAPSTAPALGIGGRVTYATSDWYAYEAQLGLEWLAGNAEHHSDHGHLVAHGGWWLRAEAGVRARLGVEWVPTLYFGLGVQSSGIDSRACQGRWQGDTWKREMLLIEPVVALGAGIDRRFGRTWLIGFELVGRQSLLADEATYRAVAAAFHVSGYWYPWLDD